jgi:imidazolonepropionase-like amidohydrolase
MTQLLLSHARILDVRAGLWRDDQSLLVEDGRIKEISDKKIEAQQAQQLDVAGLSLIPGLCDAHVHVTAATASFPDLMRWSPSYVAARAGDIMSAMLMRGFTTVRDCGGADYGLAMAVEQGFIIGPRLLFSGHAISQTGGHGDMRGPGESFEQCTCCAGLGLIADGVSQVRQACREEIRKGAHFIKIMASGGVASPTDRIGNTQFSLDEIRAAVEEAEAAELYVAAHAYTARAGKRALECGVRSIEHGNLIDEEVMDLLVAKDAFLVPTMSTHEMLGREGVAAGMPKEMCDKVFELIEAGKQTHARAAARGVRMVFGTDLLGSMHRHQLLEFSIRSAFHTPLQLIRSATVAAAELFQLEGELGVLEPGGRADLLAIEGDPVADIGVLLEPERRLKLIVKDGVIYKNTL